jgi:hypothetical protein
MLTDVAPQRHGYLPDGSETERMPARPGAVPQASARRMASITAL